MKIELFDIIFEDAETNSQSVYRSGKSIAFKVHLKLLEPVKCSKVTVTLIGKSRVKWLEHKSKTRTKTYTSEEVYIQHTVPAFTPEADGPNEGQHPAGEFFYPFVFQLPDTAPSSFEGTNGSIRYYIKACIDRPWKGDEYAKKYFTVIRDLDLNARRDEEIGPYTSADEVPVRFCFSCGCNYGKVQVNAAIGKRGYVPGEQLHVTGEIVNRSSTELDIVLMDIYQKITEHAEGKFRTSERVASSAQLPSMKTEEGLHLNHLLPVPAVPGSYLDGCSNIELQYFFRIRAGDGCCVSFEQTICELLIGTVPLQSYLLITIVPDIAQQQQTQEGGSADAVVDAQPAASPEYMPTRQHYAECTFGRVSMEGGDDGVCHCGQDSWAPSYPVMMQPLPYQMLPQHMQQAQQQQQQQNQPLEPLLHSKHPAV